MKKLIAILLSLVMLLSLAACAPNEGSTEPATDAPTEKPTEKPTEAPTDPTDDIVIGGDPTDPPAPTDPEPTDPPAAPELQANGVCAVGIVDAEAGTAKILADNGVVAEIPYTCDFEPVPGMVYEFAKNGETYTLTKIAWINGDASAWAVRTYDNNALGTPDQLYTYDGVTETYYDLTEDCVIFARFSATEYRIFRGSDAIAFSDWPCAMYFNGNENLNGGNLQTSVILVCTVDTTTWVDGDADASSTWFFDPEGYGWDDGDLIIE